MATNLRIRSLSVATNTAARSFDFASPLTLVTGTTGMGKSTLLMLIKHALGGNAALTPAVVQHVTHVDLAIQAGDNPLILRRRVGTDAGIVEIIEPGSGVVEQTWPVSPTPADGPSISRFLLEALGIPVERVPTSRMGVNARTTALTFRDVFRYCYLQAKEIDRSVVGHLDQNVNPKRIATFELMFGLTDPELLDLKRRRGLERDQAKQLEKDAVAVDRFIREAGIADPDELRARRLQLLQQLGAAEDGLRAIREEVEALTAAEEERRGRLSAALSNSKKLHEEADLLAMAVRGREAVLAQLNLDLAKAERLSTAVGLLSPFEFSTCPRCMQELGSRELAETDCLLCCQPVQPVDLGDIQSSAQNVERIHDQMAETEQLLRSDIAAHAQAQQVAGRADAELEVLHREYDQATAGAVSPRIELVARLSRETEALRQRVEETNRHAAMWRRLDQLRAQVALHRKNDRQIAVDITEREKALRRRGAQLEDIDEAFKEEIERIGIPVDGVARIDPTSFLPLVGDTAFEDLQASGGGASTALNVAYHLTLLTTAIDYPGVLLPDLLIIDSPRKAIGNREPDVALGRRLYARLVTLAETYGKKIQIIVADNDIPTGIVSTHATIDLTSQHSVVPGVTNTGVGQGQRVEDVQGEQ
ncbi:AAA family ATPase [Solwaraspora sp. WMMD406]|uniref:AAA family ATPase n=1 Tax=Solwaraspora sp. WMMD406 TaxID=3016095 RepID=UPI002417A8A5|nr:AAA family ATPase [Solwaraspora sp. WMMD406]MDG4768031.1 AAA family ATPase [Solwaraspora sp. WMMD406]